MKKIIVFYDNWCPNCHRFIKIVNKLDWLNYIEIKELRNTKHTQKFLNLNLEIATKQMASFNGKWNYGYISIYLILKRLPLIFIFFPILYLLKITSLGQLIYKELAIKRKIIKLHCDEKSCKI